jgi:hypothetical protein
MSLIFLWGRHLWHARMWLIIYVSWNMWAFFSHLLYLSCCSIHERKFPTGRSTFYWGSNASKHGQRGVEVASAWIDSASRPGHAQHAGYEQAPVDSHGSCDMHTPVISLKSRRMICREGNWSLSITISVCVLSLSLSVIAGLGDARGKNNPNTPWCSVILCGSVFFFQIGVRVVIG